MSVIRLHPGFGAEATRRSRQPAAGLRPLPEPSFSCSRGWAVLGTNHGYDLGTGFHGGFPSRFGRMAGCRERAATKNAKIAPDGVSVEAELSNRLSRKGRRNWLSRGKWHNHRHRPNSGKFQGSLFASDSNGATTVTGYATRVA
jgi:hypothetical protein